jgi:hypothetical protein
MLRKRSIDPLVEEGRKALGGIGDVLIVTLAASIVTLMVTVWILLEVTDREK